MAKYTGASVLIGVQTLQHIARRSCIATTLDGDFIGDALWDLYFRKGRSFMEKRKDSGDRKLSRSTDASEIDDVKQFKEFLKGLVLGTSALVALFIATVLTYWIFNSVPIPPDIAFLFKWIAYWFFFCGALCAVIFVTRISFAFLRPVPRIRDQEPVSKNPKLKESQE